MLAIYVMQASIVQRLQSLHLKGIVMLDSIARLALSQPDLKECIAYQVSIVLQVAAHLMHALLVHINQCHSSQLALHVQLDTSVLKVLLSTCLVYVPKVTNALQEQPTQPKTLALLELTNPMMELKIASIVTLANTAKAMVYINLVDHALLVTTAQAQQLQAIRQQMVDNAKKVNIALKDLIGPGFAPQECIVRQLGFQHQQVFAMQAITVF